jgi:hypothetical protein
MKLAAITVGILVCSCTIGQAQSSGSIGGGIAAGTAGAATGSTGNTLSNGGTINGTGGSPSPNTSNALSRGTNGNNFEASQTNPGPGSTSGNAVDTPAANNAVKSLGNTDTGVLKK